MVLSLVGPMPTRDLPLWQALGLVTGQRVVTPIDLPGFDNSAMDGYAVRAADVAAATSATPVTLPVAGHIPAGQVATEPVKPGQCQQIMTGAPLPAGADAVLPLEWTDAAGPGSRVAIERPAHVGLNIRRRGEDVHHGEEILPARTLLSSRQLGVLAAAGIQRVQVHRRPRIAVISTGSELVAPTSPRREGHIFESNSQMIAAAATEAGATVVHTATAADTTRALLDALEEAAATADLIVTTGGVGAGTHDVVRHALTGHGVEFTPVAMRPGKPQGCGLFGSTQMPMVCLPGNPVSAYVSFEILVRPALKTMLGHHSTQRLRLPAHCTDSLQSPAGRRHYVWCTATADQNGSLMATKASATGSHMIGSLSRANALIEIPETLTHITAGDQVQLIPLDPLDQLD